MSDYRFEVPNPAIVAFVAALTLGTLEAMRSGTWPLEAGISTLGRPIFQSPLREALPPPLLAVLDVADELSALQQLRGTPAAMAELDRLIAGVAPSWWSLRHRFGTRWSDARSAAFRQPMRRRSPDALGPRRELG